MLINYFKAGFPAVALETVEDHRAMTKIVAELRRSYPDLVTMSIDGTGNFHTDDTVKSNTPYSAAFTQAGTLTNGVIFVKDFHHIAKGAGGYRTLLNHLPEFKARRIMAVLLAPNWTLPPELAHEFPVLEFARPTRAELDAALSVIEAASEKPCAENIRAGCLTRLRAYAYRKPKTQSRCLSCNLVIIIVNRLSGKKCP